MAYYNPFNCIVVFIGMLGSTLAAQAQEMTVKEVLLFKKQNALLEAQQNTINYLDNKSFRLPFFDQVSLRLNTEGFYYQPHSYQLRFRNNSIAMMRSQYKGSLVRKQIENIEYDILSQTGFKERYNLLIDLYFQQRKDSMLLELNKVLKDKKNYFVKELSLGLSNKVEDILEIDEDILKTEAEMLINKEDQKLTQALLDELLGKNTTINFGDFISAEKAQISTEGMTQNIDESALLRKRKMEVELNEWKRKSSIRSNYNLLNFWSVEYQDSLKKNDLLETRISFGLAINIPVPNSNKIKIQNAKLEVLEAEKKYEADKIKLTKNIHEAKIRVKKEWNTISAQKLHLEEFLKIYDMNKLNQQAGMNPYLLYKIKTIELKKKLDIESNTAKSIKAYIDLMDQMGELGKRNCLSNAMEVLK